MKESMASDLPHARPDPRKLLRLADALLKILDGLLLILQGLFHVFQRRHHHRFFCGGGGAGGGGGSGSFVTFAAVAGRIALIAPVFASIVAFTASRSDSVAAGGGAGGGIRPSKSRMACVCAASAVLTSPRVAIIFSPKTTVAQSTQPCRSTTAIHANHTHIHHHRKDPRGIKKNPCEQPCDSLHPASTPPMPPGRLLGTYSGQHQGLHPTRKIHAPPALGTILTVSYPVPHASLPDKGNRDPSLAPHEGQTTT